MKEIGVYIHIPFCKQKCFYCDFPSYALKEELMSEYVDALIIEIKEKLININIRSIFIGGGTPSYLPSELLEKLLSAIYNITDFKNIEYTVECNPGTLDYNKLNIMKRYGVNRLSFGLQATQNDFLKKIGRIHNYETFLDNLKIAREIGFNNINVDLMYGLPNQTKEDWKETLETICNLNVTHISAYSLIVEEGTAFYSMYEKGLLDLPSEDDEREMNALTKEILSKYGYKQYEISNYAKSGYECEHNKVYWCCDEYIGLGSASSSYINNLRYSNEIKVDEYIKLIKNGEDTRLDIHSNSEEDNIEEFMFMGLRMIDGIDKNEFRRRFHQDLEGIYGMVIEKNKARGLIKDNDDRVYLTEKGIEISNSIMCEFILEK